MGNQLELPAVFTTVPFRALKFNEARLYLLAGAFIALDVALPWACHQFHPLAGPTFLPMHLFVILAGLLFGWRAGLLVGLVTPLVSFAVSGMPVLAVLPQITVEIVFYGLASGILREKFNLGIFWSVLGAMLIGRLFLGLAVLLIYLGGVNPFHYVWSVIAQGWPGMLSQLVILPLLVKWLSQYWGMRDARR
jgi:hypothetical protein